ncbi:hypothetical protein [Methylibium sp.]|uniref:hypothetical protein n=1 Tax=Methylibium sp. TaxID=2067992 RepID=UPI003D0F3C96
MNPLRETLDDLDIFANRSDDATRKGALARPRARRSSLYFAKFAPRRLARK